MSSLSKEALSVKKILTLLLIPLMFSLNICFAYAKTLIPGGESIGVVMRYDGVLITGDYSFEADGKNINPNKDVFHSGDLIQSIEGHEITSNDDLVDYIRQALPNKTTLNVQIERQNHILDKELTIYYDKANDSFKTGLYIKDNIAGIGTITFYDPETKSYGALGHQMVDTDLESSSELEITSGEAFDAYILSIDKSGNGHPGQKMARIEKNRHLGNVLLNNQYGIYGYYDTLYKEDVSQIEVAKQSDVVLGEATILTVVNGKEVNRYTIEITDLKTQTTQDVKGITFKVTDETLLSQTNGVIQGMSGSPIIQNGKLVGAVTHVMIDDTRYGYGLYIEWMLEENNKMIS